MPKLKLVATRDFQTPSPGPDVPGLPIKTGCDVCEIDLAGEIDVQPITVAGWIRSGAIDLPPIPPVTNEEE